MVKGGAAFAVNGVLQGLELFDSPSTLRKLLPKIASSYALEALASQTLRPVAAPASGVVRELLALVAGTRYSAFDAIGEGTDLRLQSDRISGGALYARDRIVHLCVFLSEHEPPRASMASLRARRRAREEHRSTEG